MNATFWKDKRVLITGHTGFKGSWLALVLIEAGAQVTGISLEPENYPNLYCNLDLHKRFFNSHILNILDFNALNEIIGFCQPHIVIHLAGLSGLKKCESEPKKAFKINVEGTANVVKGCLKINAKLIFISSREVYGETINKKSK